MLLSARRKRARDTQAQLQGLGVLHLGRVACINARTRARWALHPADMQKERAARRGPHRDFLMWHDYLGLGAVVARMARAGDVTQPQTPSSQGAWPGLGERAWCPDTTPGTSGSGERSPGSQGLEQVAERSACGFCRQNGESAEVYTSHRLKARSGRVLCPVLRSYVCPTCGATGDTAHTRHYCPARALAHKRPDVSGPRWARAPEVFGTP